MALTHVDLCLAYLDFTEIPPAGATAGGENRTREYNINRDGHPSGLLASGLRQISGF